MASKTQVKKSLITQLEMKGADIDVLKDRVDGYMRLWDIEKKLAKDIHDRGITYREPNVKGEMITKNNPSTKEIVAVNNQMISILKNLGLSVETVVKPMEDGVGERDEL